MPAPTDQPAPPTRVATRCWRLSWVLLLATLAITACGSSSPADQVRQAWSNLKGALVAGNTGKFCALLSDQARAQLLVQIAAVSPASTCAAAANTFFDITRDARAQAAKAKLTSVTVHGDQATTADTTGPPPNSWIKVQGSWQLASFPSSGSS
jgi:hypothetical protein